MPFYATPKCLAKVYFDLLDGNVCMDNIAPFLDYESRMNFNQTLPNQYRYAKKMNSDAHNFDVKISLMSKKTSRIDQYEISRNQRLRYIKEVMTYLLNTKDDALICFSGKLRETIIERATHFSNIESYPHGGVFYNTKKINELISVSTRLVSKIESIKPRENMINKCVKFV